MESDDVLLRENRGLRAEILFEGTPQLALGGQLLDDRFDDHVAVFEIFEIRGAAQPVADLIAIAGGGEFLSRPGGRDFFRCLAVLCRGVAVRLRGPLRGSLPGLRLGAMPEPIRPHPDDSYFSMAFQWLFQLPCNCLRNLFVITAKLQTCFAQRRSRVRERLR